MSNRLKKAINTGEKLKQRLLDTTIISSGEANTSERERHPENALQRMFQRQVGQFGHCAKLYISQCVNLLNNFTKIFPYWSTEDTIQCDLKMY